MTPHGVRGFLFAAEGAARRGAACGVLLPPTFCEETREFIVPRQQSKEAGVEPAKPRSWRFFISYASGNVEAAHTLFSLLGGLEEVFIAPDSIPLGSEYDQALLQGLRASRVIVLLISSANRAAYFAREEAAIATGLARSHPDKHVVVPVYLQGVPNPEEMVVFGVFLRQAIDVPREGGLAGAARRLKALAQSTGNGEGGDDRADPAHGFKAPSPAVILAIPIGPAVRHIPTQLVDEVAAIVPARDAASVVDEAVALRIAAEPSNASVTYLRHEALPPPETNAPIVYWRAVFREAALHGPRMLGALLLAIPRDRLDPTAQTSLDELFGRISGDPRGGL